MSIDAPPEPPTVAEPTPRRRRLRIVLAAAVVLLAAAGVTTGILVDKYAYPTSMDVNAYVWGPDETGLRNSSAGSWDELAVASRPNAVQTFYLEVTNLTGVAQTIVGIQPGLNETEENPRFGIATVDSYAARFDSPWDFTFVAGGVTINPGGSRYLRWQFHSSSCESVGSHRWRQDLPLRIRTGWFTRSTNLKFAETAMATYGTAKSC